MQTQSPAPVDLVNAGQQGMASGTGATTLNQAMPNQAIPRPQVAAPTTPFSGATGSYGSGVRAQVFEVIVRQALAGAPWREICAGPMQVNNISADEVEAEVKRRQALLKK
jgi:phosphoribosylaminoimidazole-succinocarboxamide synthase